MATWCKHSNKKSLRIELTKFCKCLFHYLTSTKQGGSCIPFITDNSIFNYLVKKEIKPYLWFTEAGWHKRTWSHIQIPLFSPTVFWIQCSNPSIQSADNYQRSARWKHSQSELQQDALPQLAAFYAQQNPTPTLKLSLCILQKSNSTG